MYKINYEYFGDNYILQAMKRADDFALPPYKTNDPIIVHNDDFTVMAIRYWVNEPTAYPTSFDIIMFEGYGYYTPWVISVLK